MMTRKEMLLVKIVAVMLAPAQFVIVPLLFVSQVLLHSLYSVQLSDPDTEFWRTSFFVRCQSLPTS